MQAADYFADEAAMQELCRLLGSRLFEERCPEDASAEMLEEKRRTDNKVRMLTFCCVWIVMDSIYICVRFCTLVLCGVRLNCSIDCVANSLVKV